MTVGGRPGVWAQVCLTLRPIFLITTLYGPFHIARIASPQNYYNLDFYQQYVRVPASLYC